MRILTLLAGLILSLATTPADARDTGFLDRTATVAGVAHRYQVYVPRDVKRGERLPVILALHGAGERGSDGLLQTDVGLGHAVRQHPERWRAIIVFPQAPADRLWQNSAAIALAALDATQREFRTDRGRTYLAGLSMGGNAAWKIVYENPGRFAAIVVICGFVQPIAIRDYEPIVPADAGDPFTAIARRIATLPVWIVHGDRDDVVPVADSRAMAVALTAAGARVTYRELKGVNHNAWDPGFGDPALPAWLFAVRREVLVTQ